MMIKASYVHAIIPQSENKNIIYPFPNHPFFYFWSISWSDTVFPAFTTEGYNINEIEASSSEPVQDNNNNNCNSSAADLIVYGRVLNISNVEYTETLVKEHDPKWMRAVVQVETVEKGNDYHNIQQVEVFFPGSNDIAWKDSPRLFIGEKATFILHMDPISELNGEEHYAVVCHSDVQLRS